MNGITRQSEQYGIFDNTPRPERVAREAPAEVVREYTRGRSVGAGMLNPRGRTAKKTWCPDCQSIVQEGGHSCGDEEDDEPAKKEAVNTRGMDPEEHAYHGHPAGGYAQETGHFGPPEIAEHEEPRYEENALGIDADDESGYNWGPDPHHEDPYGGHAPSTPLQPLDDMLEHTYRPDPSPPHFGKTATVPFLPGNRVGLPYKDTVIRGIVTHLRPDAQVGIRWSDGQHSVESPGDIQPL